MFHFEVSAYSPIQNLTFLNNEICFAGKWKIHYTGGMIIKFAKEKLAKATII